MANAKDDLYSSKLCVLDRIVRLPNYWRRSYPPPSTGGGGWVISTGYISPTIISSAPETTVTGVWQSDGANSAGDPSEFVVTTDSVALAAVGNGRVPATWKITWNSSLSFPEVCDGFKAIATPSFQGVTEEVNCIVVSAEAAKSTFTFQPNPINLYYGAPATSTIIGSGFKSTYGRPVVQYFNSQGKLISQASATSVSADGTTITAPTPNLSQVAYGVYAGIISNIASNGSYQYAGAVSVTVENLMPKQPPICPINAPLDVICAPIP